MRRAAQTEFVICDQSIDINHGFAKTPVVNSEVSKKRGTLEKRLANVQRWGEAARVKAHRASALSTRIMEARPRSAANKCIAREIRESGN